MSDGLCWESSLSPLLTLSSLKKEGELICCSLGGTIFFLDINQTADPNICRPMTPLTRGQLCNWPANEEWSDKQTDLLMRNDPINKLTCQRSQTQSTYQNASSSNRNSLKNPENLAYLVISHYNKYMYWQRTIILSIVRIACYTTPNCWKL